MNERKGLPNSIRGWLAALALIPTRTPDDLQVGTIRLAGTFDYDLATDGAALDLKTGANWVDKGVQRKFFGGSAPTDVQIAEYTLFAGEYDITIGAEAALANEEPSDLFAVAKSLYWRFEGVGYNVAEEAFSAVRWQPFWNTGVALIDSDETVITERVVTAGITAGSPVKFASGPYCLPISMGTCALRQDGSAANLLAANASLLVRVRGAVALGSHAMQTDCSTPQSYLENQVASGFLGKTVAPRG